MSADLKHAVERLESALWPTVIQEDIMAVDVAAVLSALALTQAECRAWRAFDWQEWPEDKPQETAEWKQATVELADARAATDAAGALGEVTP